MCKVPGRLVLSLSRSSGRTPSKCGHDGSCHFQTGVANHFEMRWCSAMQLSGWSGWSHSKCTSAGSCHFPYEVASHFQSATVLGQATFEMESPATFRLHGVLGRVAFEIEWQTTRNVQRSCILQLSSWSGRSHSQCRVAGSRNVQHGMASHSQSARAGGTSHSQDGLAVYVVTSNVM